MTLNIHRHSESGTVQNLSLKPFALALRLCLFEKFLSKNQGLLYLLTLIDFIIRLHCLGQLSRATNLVLQTKLGLDKSRSTKCLVLCCGAAAGVLQHCKQCNHD
jgi:hypothetical protein